MAIVLAKVSTQWLFAFHFPEILLITSILILKSDWLFCFTVPLLYSPRLRKRCNLEQKVVRYVNEWHHESQSDCKDNQWFQNGFNKYATSTYANALYVQVVIWFREKFGINLHEWVFQKAEIARATSAGAISAFWETHKCKVIPN